MCFLTGCSGQTKQQTALTTAETNAATTALGAGTSNLTSATAGLQAPLNFFQQLLSGNRGAVMQALSPEISSLTSQYDTGRKTEEEFAPRGGGRAAALATEPTTEAGQIATLVNGARTEGAQGVVNIEQLLADIGLGELGSGGSIADSAFGNIQTAKVNEQQQGAAAGQAVGSLIALLAA